MITDRDWVMRAVKQLADFIARALKLAREDKPEQAIEVLQGACIELLGIEYRALAVVDARSAIELLGTKARAKAFIELVEAMSGVEPDASRRQSLLAHATELRDALATW